MSSGLVTAFAMIAFVAIVIWVFVVKRKEDFDEQANLPLDEENRRRQDKDQKDKENSS
ncbi:cbb3-type cytochrome oxidase subunit 3 [Wenzhouxiangella sediminis]|uniref:Cbb3-type cytochrome c oxidase subunit 3 n=1 Tax=Wenzhouxiangella sediminis TaxID=1792836 RepID=A0A3E1K891_9GAMM|nr:cbb3-type cytochrome c oxidase subunit 3 [Wenzhouxiangella sediminis]RFF30231.1 cbb3-type cytochrome c oxidase subunit 3 [Wenzhouxiangella sediminis]